MNALGRFLVRVVLVSVVAVGIPCLAGMVHAEMAQSTRIVTQVYPEIAAKTLILHSTYPVKLNPDMHEQGISATANNGLLKTVGYAEILGRQFASETGRRKYDLTDMEVQALVSEINIRSCSAGAVPLFVHRLDEQDLDLMNDYGEDVLREAADEAIQEIGWLDNLENRASSLFRYELFFGGAEQRKYSNREFAWEDRKEKLREDETTVVRNPARAGGPFDAHYGLSLLNVGTSNASFVEVPYAYVRWERLPVIDRIKVKVQPMEEVSVSLRNSINKRWYWQNKALLDDRLDPKVQFSLTRRDEARKNRLTFFTEYGVQSRVGIMFGALL